jgi:hypothetical protein
MTSPVSAIEAIEKAMEGVTHPAAPEWIAVAQDGDGPNGGFWTCAAATTESPRYIRADIYSALARQAEALQRENAALKEANGVLEDALQEAGDDYPGSKMQEWCQQQVRRARALLGGENAE